ncbi:MAG: FixH family protein [Epsilonproteobacteria bacterium]|nr:FixH family protein [Campylobacterota bacterium]
MAKPSSGKIWPYILVGSITAVFGMCVWTVKVTSSANIQESDVYMTNYQDADKKANDFINARIAFDKKYNVKYVTEDIGGKQPVIKYQLTDKEGKAVENGKIVVQISRPETAEFDQTLENFTQEDGVYSLSGAKFPKAGVWNIIAKITIGDNYRFYNIKADTRIKEAFEF